MNKYPYYELTEEQKEEIRKRTERLKEAVLELLEL